MSEAKRYQKWITRQRCVEAKCFQVTLAMLSAFPELKQVRGHYHCPFWGPREHWWCVAPDGSIVDPTASQFPSKGSGEYVEHIEGSPEPTGKCHDCGGYTYNGDSFCSEKCEQATMNYLGFKRKENGAWHA